MLPAYNLAIHPTARHLERENMDKNDSSSHDNGSDAITVFEAYWNQHRGMIFRTCKRALHTGMLEENDIMGETYIAWETARQKWDPEKARFTTLVLNTLRYRLHELYPSLFQAPEHLHETPDNPVSADADSAPSPYAEERGEHADGQDAQDDSWMLALFSFLPMHPAWHHARYRRILQRLREPHTARDASLYRTLSQDLDLGDRRIRQIVADLHHILAIPDIRRDYALPLQDPLHAEDFDSALRYVPIADLQPPDLARQQVRAIQTMTRRLETDQRILVPLIVDQNHRILDGWTRFFAAAQLRLQTVPVLYQPVRDSRTDQYDDPLYWRLRHHLTGRVRPKNIRPSAQIRLF